MLVPAKRSAGRLQTLPIWFLHLILVMDLSWPEGFNFRVHEIPWYSYGIMGSKWFDSEVRTDLGVLVGW